MMGNAPSPAVVRDTGFLGRLAVPKTLVYMTRAPRARRAESLGVPTETNRGRHLIGKYSRERDAEERPRRSSTAGVVPCHVKPLDSPPELPRVFSPTRARTASSSLDACRCSSKLRGFPSTAISTIWRVVKTGGAKSRRRFAASSVWCWCCPLPRCARLTSCVSGNSRARKGGRSSLGSWRAWPWRRRDVPLRQADRHGCCDGVRRRDPQPHAGSGVACEPASPGATATASGASALIRWAIRAQQ